MINDLRSQLLLALRSKRWRSTAQLRKAVAGKHASSEVEPELDRMRDEKLIEFWDLSLVRHQLTAMGRNVAKRVADAQKGRKAA